MKKAFFQTVIILFLFAAIGKGEVPLLGKYCSLSKTEQIKKNVSEESKLSPSFKEAKEDWYHLKMLEFRGKDSIKISMFPVYLKNGDTIWSASTGGFYSGKGKYRKRGHAYFIKMKLGFIEYAEGEGLLYEETLQYESGVLFGPKEAYGRCSYNDLIPG